LFKCLFATKKKQIIETFEKYKNLNQRFIIDSKEDNRRILEEFAEEEVYPSLIDLQKILCKSKDTVLLVKFIDMLLATKNSSDENPINTLGYIYIYQPQMIMDYFDSIKSKDDKKTIIKYLEFGLLNISTEMKEKYFEYLKTNIDSLKNSF
jgi:hypothetical protein